MDDRTIIATVCLHSLLNQLTPQDMVLFKQTPNSWDKFVSDTTQLSVNLADQLIDKLQKEKSEH